MSGRPDKVRLCQMVAYLENFPAAARALFEGVNLSPEDPLAWHKLCALAVKLVPEVNLADASYGCVLPRDPNWHSLPLDRVGFAAVFMTANSPHFVFFRTSMPRAHGGHSRRVAFRLLEEALLG